MIILFNPIEVCVCIAFLFTAFKYSEQKCMYLMSEDDHSAYMLCLQENLLKLLCQAHLHNPPYSNF